MATTRSAFGAVMGSVKTAATMTTTTLATAESSIEMLGAFVEKARREQEVRYHLQSLTSEDRLVQEARVEAVERKEMLDTWLAKGGERRSAIWAEVSERIKL